MTSCVLQTRSESLVHILQGVLSFNDDGAHISRSMTGLIDHPVRSRIMIGREDVYLVVCVLHRDDAGGVLSNRVIPSVVIQMSRWSFTNHNYLRIETFQ